MAIHYRTPGLILKKTDRGEADQLFTIYTEDFGKLDILGRAIRKIKSKLRSGAELFYLSELEFIQGKTCKTLTDALTIEKFQETRRDLEKLETAFQIAELTDDLINGQEKDEKIWHLLNEAFYKLNTCSKFQVQPSGESLASLHPASSRIYCFFLWNLLSILGYHIDLYNCSLCQKKLVPEKLYFNPEQGGIICFGCFLSARKGREISPEEIKILRLFLEKDWQTLTRLKIDNFLEESLKLISEDYLSFVRDHR